MKKINFFVDYEYEGITDFIKEIQKKYIIENLYLISTSMDGSTVLKQEELGNISVYRYDYRKLMLVEYEDYIFSREAPPVDENILQELAPYASEVFKMMERGGYEAESFEDRMNAYTKHIRYWNYMLDAADIDFVYHTMPPHSVQDYLIFRLCQIKGIRVGMFDYLPVQHKKYIFFERNYEEWREDIANKVSERINNGDVVLSNEFENEFRMMTKPKTHVVPYIVNGTMMQRMRSKIDVFKYYGKKDFIKTLKKTVNHLRKRHYLDKLLRFYQKIAIEPDYRCRYIYFPLHYQPEMTTSPLGGWFVHQYLAIEMLSFFAPSDVLIYVKEHPAYKTHPNSTRYKELYTRIMKLENVRLISFSADTVSLVENCAAVASITGSVGYEALFKEKPYIMFGEHVMKYSPGTVNVRNNEDCKLAMKKIFEEGFKPSLNDARGFLKVLSEIGIEINDEKQKAHEISLFMNNEDACSNS